jgi:hypothetical protein
MLHGEYSILKHAQLRITSKRKKSRMEPKKILFASMPFDGRNNPLTCTAMHLKDIPVYVLQMEETEG